MLISIANYGRSLRPWYNDARIPQGAIFGTATMRYEYFTDETSNLTIKQLVFCDKIPWYCTDFRATNKPNKYKRCANIPVYNIVVWDIEHKKFIHTNTSASARYYYIGEQIDKFVLNNNLQYTHVLPVAYLAKNAPCQMRTTGKYMYKGAYGYMCKTPDRTITEMPVIGDDFAENRRFKRR